MACELKHRSSKTVTKGTHHPLGATLTPDGVNLAIYSKQATNVFLLLFDTPDGEPTDIIEPRIDPADHYLVNPRSTVVVLAQQSKSVKTARPAQPKAAVTA